jgi:hypothetical protein
MIRLPAMSTSQEQSWHGILDVAERLPRDWCLVGGQMVFLWCAERGGAPARPTDDVDTILDVRAKPTIVPAFTRALRAVGFEPDGESWEGHQHRWVRGEAVIDILIPRGVGERARSRKGVTGGTTMETPGAQGVLDQAEPVEVLVGERSGTVQRPSLPAAIAAKAAAYLNPQDSGRQRHLIDIAVLGTLLQPGDTFDNLAKRDLDRARRGMDALQTQVAVAASVEGGDAGVQRLALALDDEADH